ncbi:MAG: DegT/DnrJ/EryC1/StrS family aminotransferase [Lentisphaeria bacterium]|nr:DegT/DnrJ/EryC1/StrS family aminotransferase [Lentisphaeria bacterium]
MNKLAVNGGTPVFGGKKMMDLIPPWPPRYPETAERLLEVYNSGKWSGCSVYEQKLMTEFAEFQDAKYSVWMANGTVTLECALLALGVGPGDEVIVPGVSWLATAQAPDYVGATPVIVDIDPDTLCIDPARIEEAITPRTKAIIPVHIFSAVADMDRIMAIAKKHNLYVIEDCAHAHGAKQHGKGVGSIGDVGSFSFQLSKIMTAGEGGCCTVNDIDVCDRIFRASHIGNSRIKPENELPATLSCHQYRFTEFQAAVIYDQLHHEAELRAKRISGMKLLNGLLRDTPGIYQQTSSCEDDLRAYYFPTFLLKPNCLKEGITRADVYKALSAEGVLFHEGWGAPLYDFPSWNVPKDKFVKHETPVCADVMYNRVVITHNAVLLMDDKNISRVAEALDKVMRAYTA